MQKVFVYQDYGCAEIVELINFLKIVYKNADVQTIDAATVYQLLKIPKAERSQVLLVIGGGAALPFYEKLKARRIGFSGVEIIQEFVKTGGNFLGICAGGYFGTKKYVFEKGAKTEIISNATLKLANAIAKGTLKNQFNKTVNENEKIVNYDSTPFSAAAINVEIETNSLEKNSEVKVYYHGGCYFEINNTKEISVLANYSFKNSKTFLKLPAVISGSFGNGRFLLSGVHFETSSKNFTKGLNLDSPNLKRIKLIQNKLLKTEELKLSLFTKLLNEFPKARKNSTSE